MNVLLISVQRDLDIIGLKYLHYCLRNAGYNSFLLHLPNFNHDDEKTLEHIREFISKIDPGFIAISLMDVEFIRARELTKYLKKMFDAIPVVWGGIHPTIFPENCIKYADYVCIGEGELTILDIADTINRNGNIKTINNLCYMEDGKIKRNALYPLITDLDTLPIYEHIPINSYLQEENAQIIPIDSKIFSKYERYRGTIYNIMSSRGCPFSCTYCCNNYISKLYNSKKIRRRGINNIILELKRAVNENKQIEYINFQDDCFLACSDEYLEEFCDIYEKEIKMPFVVRSIPTYLNRKKVESLKRAGLAWISIGLQSGSDRVCNEIFKRRSLKADFLRTARIINGFKIAAFYDVILDNPFENEEDMLETIDTLIETPRPFYTQLFSLTLYSGTELLEKARKECPEKIENTLEKDYLVYNKSALNALVRLSGILNKNIMKTLVYIYKRNPSGIAFRTLLGFSKFITLVYFEPIMYFRVIKLSQRGSVMKTLKVMPNYLKEGLMRYFIQFKGSNKINLL